MDLELTLGEDFTPNERLIGKLILIQKGWMGIEGRMVGMYTEDVGGPGNIEPLAKLAYELTSAQSKVHLEVAKAFGISKQRYNEIHKFVYTKEQTI